MVLVGWLWSVCDFDFASIEISADFAFDDFPRFGQVRVIVSSGFERGQAQIFMELCSVFVFEAVARDSDFASGVPYADFMNSVVVFVTGVEIADLADILGGGGFHGFGFLVGQLVLTTQK
jgi:hypothetical protein